MSRRLKTNSEGDGPTYSQQIISTKCPHSRGRGTESNGNYIIPKSPRIMRRAINPTRWLSRRDCLEKEKIEGIYQSKTTVEEGGGPYRENLV